MAQGRVNPTLVTIIIIVLLGAGAGGIYAYNQSQNQEPATTQSSSSSETAETPSTSETTVTTYTDGTYSADGDYSTPGGSEDISIEVTLAGGIITDIDATGSATGGNSAQYQRQFFSGYKDEVVGKSIDEVRLSRVAG